MKTLRLILLVAIVALSNNSAQSQDNQQQQISGTTNYSNVRKMEVFGYASVNIPPNEVYVSFTTKEFIDKNGKLVTLAEQEKLLKKAVVDIGYSEKNLKVMNMFGFETYNLTADSEKYEKARLYLLKLRGINCIDKFLAQVDMKLLSNFNIENFYHDNIYQEARKLQVEAFKRGQEKADTLLAVYGEKRGRILDIQEMSMYIAYPKTHGQSGNTHQIISMKEGTQYKEMRTNDLQDIKMEYQVKLVFEIITENNKK